MKKHALIGLLMFSILLMATNRLHAQFGGTGGTPGAGGTGGGFPTTGGGPVVPFDGGMSLMLAAAGIGYAKRKLKAAPSESK